MGSGTPFTVRHDSPRAVGSGISLVAILTGLKSRPRTVIRLPGASPRDMSAALTTCSICGGLRRVVAPRQHGEARDRQGNERSAVGERRQRADERCVRRAGERRFHHPGHQKSRSARYVHPLNVPVARRRRGGPESVLVHEAKPDDTPAVASSFAVGTRDSFSRILSTANCP